MKKLAFLLLCIPTLFFGKESDQIPTYHITMEGIKNHCDFIYDKEKPGIKPIKIKRNQTIYVKGCYLKDFFTKIHPKIRSKYILVSHNSDQSLPGEFAPYLDDPKITAWFGVNAFPCHPKMIPLPIGIRSWCISPKTLRSFNTVLSENHKKENLLYVNFLVRNNVEKREELLKYFKKQPFVTCTERKPALDYFRDIKKSYFVLSPEGNGWDCFRTWEAIYLGAIPIIEKSERSALYEDLPVLIVDHFDMVNEKMLNEAYRKIHSRPINLQKLSLNYWLNFIDSYKKK